MYSTKIFDKSDVINISFNEIRELHISKNVDYLIAANNKIKRLSIETGSAMWSLDLSNNCFENLQDSDLFYAENLENLDLSNNYLGPLNISLFSRLTNLEVLNLRGTNISNIQLGTFSHQHALNVLNISDNSLGQLDFHWFSSIDGLDELFISGNRLKKIENLSEFRTIFPILYKISISNNDFECSYLLEIVKLMKSSRVEIVRYDAPPVRHESNVKGIGCVGDVPTEDDNKTSTSTGMDELNLRLKFISDLLEKMSKTGDGTSPNPSNYFMEFSVGAAAFMIIIYTSIKLIDYFKFKSFQGTRRFELSSFNDQSYDS
jgi:Leucine-rich repeat (LRR) protein